MSVRRMQWYLGLSVFITLAALGATIAANNEPVLGLDLQGGISIVYEAVGQVKPGALDVARDIIDQRVNSLGVAEPEISRQERTITVDLPGVKNRAEAARIVGQTGELRFRSVLAEVGPPGAASAAASSTSTTTATTGAGAAPAPSTTTSTTLSPNDAAVKAAVASCDPTQVQSLLASGVDIPTTSREGDTRDACVVLREQGSKNRLYLGATQLTGSGVDSAKSQLQSGQGYVVNVSFNDKGAATFDQIAAKSFHQTPPMDRVAIVLDGIVQSSPQFQTNSFSGDVQISGGTGASAFTADSAGELAKVINYGALPVRLTKLTTTDVSPTLGRDQLSAGIAAGLIGLVLVALYMLVYYRLLGAVVIVGLTMSAILTYALITFFSQEIGLALTLAGVTGIIVSIGITVDSYIVYFERLKDEVRSGKTVRSSVDRGFTRAFRTIIAADLVSLLGAVALYLIATSSVRGFAFFLGLSTILDLLVAYFFMHPVVSLMARRPHLVRMRRIGIAAGLDEPGMTA
jgi:preprotein translocase subunit SecD